MVRGQATQGRTARAGKGEREKEYERPAGREGDWLREQVRHPFSRRKKLLSVGWVERVVVCRGFGEWDRGG